MLASTASASSCLDGTQLCQRDAAPVSNLHSSLREFQWQLDLKQKLLHVFCSISRHFYLQNLCCVQVWLSAIGSQHEQNLGQMQLYADPNLALLGDAGFSQFRTNSCHNILPGRYGMPGRVWIGGCVQVVQNISIIPNCLHPRSKLSDELVEHVGEVVYITVYDPSRPHVGPVAVLEALFACKSTDSMMVANFISFVGSALLQMKLTLSDPAPKPFKCSKLAGRKPVLTSEPDVATEQQQQQQQQQQAALAAAAAEVQPAAAVPASSTAGGAGAVGASGEDEDEGCGDTHASDDEGDTAGLGQQPAAVADASGPGNGILNRPVKKLLGKRKGIESPAVIASDYGQCPGGDTSKRQQRQMVGEAVPAVSRAGATNAASAGGGAVSDQLSPPSAAVGATSNDSTHGPAAAAMAAAGDPLHGSHNSLRAVAVAVAAVAPSGRSDATAAAATAIAMGGVMTCSAVSQLVKSPTLLDAAAVAAMTCSITAAAGIATGGGGACSAVSSQRRSRRIEAAAAAAAVTCSAVSQEGTAAALLGAMPAPRPVNMLAVASGDSEPRPRKMPRGLSMTRTKSVPMDLCVMEVASTASSRPKATME